MKKTEIRKILEKHQDAKRDKLIPILQEVQEKEGYLSPDAIALVGRHLGLSASKVYGVATFYNMFKFHPNGKYHVMICRGTACHVKGSLKVLEALQNELKIKAGETSRDGMFSIEVVACIGACGLAPVISVNGEFHAGVDPAKIPQILDSYRKKDHPHPAAANGHQAAQKEVAP